MLMARFRFWDYGGGLVVEVPVDAPNNYRPPENPDDVPAHWVRSTSRGGTVLDAGVRGKAPRKPNRKRTP